MKFYFWLASRMLLSRTSQLFSLSGLNALVGLILGVACLVVSMAVMSGFESTLQQSVADVTGHLQILIKSGQNQLSKDDLIGRIKKVTPDFVSAVRFAQLEAVIAHEGKISGVFIQGLDPEHLSETLGLEKRVVEGKLDISKQGDAVIGLGLARSLKLQVGQEFRVVLPLKDDLNPNQFRRKVGTFKITGIMDLGKYEFNQRMILTSLSSFQKFAEVGDRYSGLLVRLNDIEKARDLTTALTRELGLGFIVRNWRDANENLFEAVRIEKPVIFTVILVIVLAAAFNVSSTLYINVITRFSEIGLLKAMGVPRKGIIQVFSCQGLLIGLFGIVGGFALGLGLCGIFGWVESHYGLLQGSVYKLDHINLMVRPLDALAIAISTLLICFLATLAPAMRGASLSPVEGLKNE